MGLNRFIRLSSIVALGLILVSPSRAHDGPEHEIEELNEQIEVLGHTPELLILRGIEYNVLGDHAAAAKDLEHALDLDANSAVARRHLSRTYFALGKTNEALAEATRGLRAPADKAELAALYITRAEILRARRDYSGALNDANEAIQRYPANVEWYLIRSQLQELLGLHAERVKGLEDGIRETGGGILLGEWVEALIRAGKHEEASRTIAREIRGSRWKAAWLIRRARLKLAIGGEAEARTDLEAALAELNRRMEYGTPDALLLADRAQAHDLLGQASEARRDYRAALDKGLNDERIRQRLRALREADRAAD